MGVRGQHSTVGLGVGNTAAMLAGLLLAVVWISGALAQYGAPQQESPPPRAPAIRPADYMVYITNNLAVNILYEHDFFNDNNIAFSPYGLIGILVALYEGVDGASALQIREALHLPSNRDILRIGFRDIHRRLRSYFIPKEGFLAGLVFNNENVTFTQEYKDILQFYGYDFDMPKSASSNTSDDQSTETITTTMSTMGVTTITTDKPESITTMSPTTISMASSLSQDAETFMPSTVAETTETTTMETTTEMPTTITTPITTITEQTTMKTTSALTTTTTAAPTTTTTTTSAPTTITTTSAATTITTTSAPTTTTTSAPTTTTTPILTTTTPPSTEAITTLESTTSRASTDSTTTDSFETITMDMTQDTAETSMTNRVTRTTNAQTSIQTTKAVGTSTIFLTEKTQATSQQETTKFNSQTTTEMPKFETTTEMFNIDTTTEEGETLPTTLSEDQSTIFLDSTISETTINPEESRKKRSVFEHEFISPADYDYLTFLRPFNPRYPDFNDVNHLQHQRSFLTNGFEKVEITYMTYDTILEFAYVPYLRSMALKLPLDTSEYYLLIILPDYEYGVRQLIKDLASNRSPTLEQINRMLTMNYVRAWVPTFMLKGFVILTGDLQKLGVCDVFEPRQNDFRPMTAEKNIYVRNIEQAITVSIRKYMEPNVKKRHAQNRLPIEFAATHPFLYFVMDSEMHTALMAGKIVNPRNSRIQ